jgi:NADH:ubiquinone oxidoreductase subunit 4 (subunit M)
LVIAVPLVLLAIVFGVAPQAIFRTVTPTVNRQVEALATWTRQVHDARPALSASGPVADVASTGAQP